MEARCSGLVRGSPSRGLDLQSISALALVSVTRACERDVTVWRKAKGYSSGDGYETRNKGF